MTLLRVFEKDRNVPTNPHTGSYLSNLEMHLLDQSKELVKRIRATQNGNNDSILDAISLGLSFVGGFSINIGKLMRSVKGR
jgi:hypothetical protein